MPADSGAPHLLPYPEPTDPPDVAGDIARLAERVHTRLDTKQPLMIEATTPGEDFGASGPPVSLFGPGRPDSAGLNLTAPVGSVYTFSGDQSQLDAVFGARRWSKGPSGWYVTDGDTGWADMKSTNPDGLTMTNAFEWHVRRLPNTIQCYLQVAGPVAAGKLVDVATYTEGTEAARCRDAAPAGCRPTSPSDG